MLRGIRPAQGCSRRSGRERTPGSDHQKRDGAIKIGDTYMRDMSPARFLDLPGE